MGLLADYDVQRDKIYSNRTSTEFSFIGIKNDPNKVRSYEGIDICWVEEANKVFENQLGNFDPHHSEEGLSN